MIKIGIKIICLVLVIASFATSCQKEISAEGLILDSTNVVVDPGNTGNPSGLLVKVDVRGGVNATDSSITYYSYDAAKRLISQRLVGSPTGGVIPNNSFTYVRNASGIITQVVQKNASLSAQGVDSVISIVFYDASAARYKYSLTTTSIPSFGISTVDSVVFVYDASGKLSQYLSYQQSSFTGTQYKQSLRYDFGYTGSQPTTLKGYIPDQTSTLILGVTYTSTFDSKVNPVQYGVDAPIILLSPESPNNTTSMVAASTVVAAGNFSITTTYTYNSANKPATAVIKNTSDNTTKKATFYYQQ